MNFLRSKKYTDERVTEIINESTPLDAMARQAATDAKGVDKVNLKARLDADYNEVTTLLAQIVTNVKSFEAKGDGVTDDTQAILNALNFLKPTGGVLYFPIGTYLTEPIDLTAFSNIIIRGYNSTTYFPYKNQTKIKMIATGDVAIKCSETGKEIPTVSAKGVLIENIYLDCDFKTSVGINMNTTVTVKNTCVRYSNGHGLVMEGQSYPVELRRVVSQFNKGHGLYVKAPYTTVYNLYDCEFGFNDLYGAYVEDGSTCLWQNVLIQSNKQGGLKVVQKDSANYSKPVFLERMNFVNLYTEANGTLDVADPNYEGNYAVRIEGLNTNPSTVVGKIPELTFKSCAINKSSKGGYAYIRGTDRLFTDNPFLYDALDPLYNRGVYQHFGTQLFQGLIDLKGGNIRFPDVQIPSSNANTLDDYKEGTFTFDLQTNNIKYTKSSSYAKYIKIGKQVTCFVNYKWSNKNSAPDAFFASGVALPFPAEPGTYGITAKMDVLVSGGNTDNWSVGVISANGLTSFMFSKNNNDILAKGSDFPATGELRFVFSYISEQ